MDITKIEGYREDMTAEEKLELLKNYEPSVPEGYIKKELFDKKASEIAQLKKELKARMTEEEKKEAERTSTIEELKAELESLKKEKSIAKYKANLLSIGYDDKLAEETAIALADGEIDKVFASQKILVENLKKAAKASKVADEPNPPAGSRAEIKVDYTKQIEEAIAGSDLLTAVRCTRLQQQAEQKGD